MFTLYQREEDKLLSDGETPREKKRIMALKQVVANRNQGETLNMHNEVFGLWSLQSTSTGFFDEELSSVPVIDHYSSQENKTQRELLCANVSPKPGPMGTVAESHYEHMYAAQHEPDGKSPEYVVQYTHSTTHVAADHIQNDGAMSWRNVECMTSLSPFDDERAMGQNPNFAQKFNRRDFTELCVDQGAAGESLMEKPSGATVIVNRVLPTYFGKRIKVQISRDWKRVHRTLRWHRHLAEYQPIGRVLFDEEEDTWALNTQESRYKGTKPRNVRIEIASPQNIYDRQPWFPLGQDVAFQRNSSICCPDCFVRDDATLCEGVDQHGEEAGCGSPFLWITDDEIKGTCYIPHLGRRVRLGDEISKKHPWVANYHHLADNSSMHPTISPIDTQAQSQSSTVPPAAKAKSGALKPGAFMKLTAAMATGVVDVDATDITILTTQLFEIPPTWAFENFIQIATLFVITMVAIGVWKLWSGDRKAADHSDQTPDGGAIATAPNRSRMTGAIDRQISCSWCGQKLTEEDLVRGCVRCNSRLCECGYCHQRCKWCKCKGTFCPPCNVQHKCSEFRDNAVNEEYKEREWRGSSAAQPNVSRPTPEAEIWADHVSEIPPNVPQAVPERRWEQLFQWSRTSPSPKAQLPGGSNEIVEDETIPPKAPPPSWLRTLDGIQQGPPPKASAVAQTDSDGGGTSSEDTRVYHGERYPEAAQPKAPTRKAVPMIRPEGMNRLHATALDNNPKYLPHMSEQNIAKTEAWLEAYQLFKKHDADNMPLFLVNFARHPQGLGGAWQEFVYFPVQWRDGPGYESPGGRRPGIPRPTEQRTVMGPPPYHQIVFCHCPMCILEWPMFCAPMTCLRCYSGLLPGLYAGQLPVTGSFKTYPRYQDIALILENFLRCDEVTALLRNARIPKKDVRHDTRKHTLIKKFLELATDPPCPRQVLQVRFLNRQKGFTPLYDIFQSYDAMQQFLHTMWPGGNEGQRLWTMFLEDTRGVIRNVDSLIVPVGVSLNMTRCTDS